LRRRARALNAGLALKRPESLLLAGTMYALGICVRRDWNRAMGFYVQAHDVGRSKAVKGDFADAVRKVFGRAVKRYPQSPGIHPDTAATMTFVVRLR
jgi:hypothetical protein